MIWESQCLFLKRTRKDRRHFIEQQNTNILQIKLILVFKKLIKTLVSLSLWEVDDKKSTLDK